MSFFRSIPLSLSLSLFLHFNIFTSLFKFNGEKLNRCDDSLLAILRRSATGNQIHWYCFEGNDTVIVKDKNFTIAAKKNENAQRLAPKIYFIFFLI